MRAETEESCRVCGRAIRPATAQHADGMCRHHFKTGFARFLFDRTLSPAEKIRGMALHHIRQRCMNVGQWKYTLLGAQHPEIERLLERSSTNIADDDLTIVSAYMNESNWYRFGASAMTGMFNSVRQTFHPRTVREECRTDNFKGYRGKETEIMYLRRGDIEVHFTYETGAASMAPIYYDLFWAAEFPSIRILH